ncbi:heme oxygenase-like protein [Daldinia sp. FL1419]|nr:heme oxygenase-like protein [Daldinia sp. FL1419]
MPSKTEDTAVGTPTLGEEINAATRPMHTRLNKLVVSRLRLALPPFVDDPKNYVTGLLHIAPIYQVFEREWNAILEGTPEAAKTEPRVRALLSDIYVHGLARVDAIHEDVSILLGRDNALVRSRVESISHAAVLGDYKEHIHKTIQERPHVLVAYAWVLYMALFSGGRFIRASLERTDRNTGFRAPAPDEDKHNPWDRMPGAFNAFCAEAELRKRARIPPPMNFFSFDTPEEGEDLKKMFKEALVEATSPPNSKLTEEERADVVREAQNIFEYMIRIVGELDEICGTEYEEQAAAATAK